MAICICKCGYIIEVACIFNVKVYKKSIACTKKFNLLCKLYKLNNFQNATSGEDRHKCRLNASMDQWCHTNGTVIKHITASANDSKLLNGSPKFQLESKDDDNKIEDVQRSNAKAKKNQFTTTLWYFQ